MDSFEEIFGYSLEQLKAICNDNARLEEMFGKYFEYTRPDITSKTTTISSSSIGVKKQLKAVEKKVEMKSELNEMLRLAGIDPKTLTKK